ncbi:MAG: hypothetical protein M3Y43_11930 [Pseudomonadota bacterium]|nr:hypothetical protein [Pseudomonadota bacterium]
MRRSRLDRSAKRNGSLLYPIHREADRQVGWAYRLLHAYGATVELSFEEESEAREALLEAGAEVDNIPFVAATYRSERQGALSDGKVAPTVRSCVTFSTAWRRLASTATDHLAHPVIMEHLEPKPIRLLPWVEKKLPPPWAGKSSGERFGDKRGRRPKKKRN